MILNRLEYLLMNNPARAASQRCLEAPILRRMGGSTNGGRVLEIGCGQGAGTQIIVDLFDAGRVDAFDLDPRMAIRALRRTTRNRTRAGIWIGDASALPVADATYDAVFDFGIIHHVPRWRSVIDESARVLRPGGRLFVEEPQAGLLARPLVKRLFDHPAADRFDLHDFSAALRNAGLEIVSTRKIMKSFFWIVAERTADPDRAP